MTYLGSYAAGVRLDGDFYVFRLLHKKNTPLAPPNEHLLIAPQRTQELVLELGL